jgi:hypothetical protein
LEGRHLQATLHAVQKAPHGDRVPNDSGVQPRIRDAKRGALEARRVTTRPDEGDVKALEGSIECVLQRLALG